jgi:hypothetical protein
VYGNPWTLKELEVLAKQDLQIEQVYSTLHDYVEDLHSRHGSCSDEKIVPVELKIYHSAESYKRFYGKHFLLIGDANSGLVLQRGFNKGLKEAVACAQAVDAFLRKRGLQQEGASTELEAYQDKALCLYLEEMIGVSTKIFAIETAKKMLKCTAALMDLSLYPHFTKDLLDEHKSLAIC